MPSTTKVYDMRLRRLFITALNHRATTCPSIAGPSTDASMCGSPVAGLQVSRHPCSSSSPRRRLPRGHRPFPPPACRGRHRQPRVVAVLADQVGFWRAYGVPISRKTISFSRCDAGPSARRACGPRLPPPSGRAPIPPGLRSLMVAQAAIWGKGSRSRGMNASALHLGTQQPTRWKSRRPRTTEPPVQLILTPAAVSAKARSSQRRSITAKWSNIRGPAGKSLIKSFPLAGPMPSARLGTHRGAPGFSKAFRARAVRYARAAPAGAGSTFRAFLTFPQG